MKQTYNPIENVRDFMKKFRAIMLLKPGIPDWQVIDLQRKLIIEEANEFVEATNQIITSDPLLWLTGVADAICDGLYVHHHAALAFGLDIVPLFAEVQRSNMSKLWTDDEFNCLANRFNYDCVRICPGTGKTRCWLIKRKSDGKVVKSPSYSPADLAPLIREQMTN